LTVQIGVFHVHWQGIEYLIKCPRDFIMYLNHVTLYNYDGMP